MTNETIAEAVKNENDKSLIPILWKRVEKLLYIKCDKVYSSLKNRFAALGIEKNDIRQECYFVFLEALRAYRQPYRFVTFLEFPFKKMLFRLLKNNLDEQEIYMESFDFQSHEESYSLSETIADENSDTIYIMEQKTDSEIIREEVEKLSEKSKDVIKLYYFSDKTDSEIAGMFGNSAESVCQLRHRALSSLRRSAILRKLYYQPDITYGKGGFLNPEEFYLKEKMKRH